MSTRTIMPHAPSETVPSPFPLSFAQERLWIIDKLTDDKALYNASMLFKLEGPVSADVLERSLAEVIHRHDVLRTVFVEHDGQARAMLTPALSFRLAREDLSQHATPAEAANAHQRQLAGEPFDLAHPPLLRATLYRLSAHKYELLLTVHHIIFDGASIDVLLAELAVLYPAFAAGLPSPLMEPPVQSGMLAAAERQRISGAHKECLLAYWRENLSGELPVLALPTDHPRPPLQTFRGATLRRPLPVELAANLETFCRSERTTPFMVMLTAYAIWLCRYASQHEVVIGVPYALRADKASQGAIGFLVNTMALRMQPNGRASFRELLRESRNRCLEAYPHGELPFGELLGALGAQREMTHPPVFQAMLVVQSRRPAVQLGSGISLRYAGEVPIDKARFDVSMVLDFLDDGATLSFEYNLDLFEPATAERMLGHFLVLLGAALEQPECLASRLPLLAAEERRRMLETWNDTGDRAPEGLSHALFEAQAVRIPDAPALIHGDIVWTYRQLDQRANQLAHALQALGVDREVPVGVLLERSPEGVASMLAIFKTGGVYVPLDPAHPDERLAYMIGDARMHAIVTGQGLKPRLAALLEGAAHELPVQPVLLDWNEDAAAIGDQATTPPARGPEPLHLAYVIYTSGSTGRPKGVEIEHRAFYNLVLAKIDGFGIFPDSRVLQFVSFGFDVSVSDVCMTLAVGAQLLLRPAELVGGAALAQWLEQQAISVIVLPASVLATLPSVELPALRSVIAGGEACSAELVDRWAPGRRFINAYGPTEATICTTMARCQAGGGVPPIGKPIAHARTYVLDANLQPVPPGVTGELYIGGAGLARGYLGQPALTAEKFVPHPFAGEHAAVAAGARLYRTGDLARYLPDGSLAFVVRADNQVKIRGFRIELGEIEAVLLQHPAVQDALVSAQTFGAGGLQLVAYCVASGDNRPDGAALLTFLRTRLPEHMIPAVLIPLESFPRTTNGKIDRRALPKPASYSHAHAREPVAPRTPAEAIIADVFADVLQLPSVSVEDDFFALGGQSILAAQVMARLREQLELDLSLRLLFEAPTVAALALRVEDALAEQIDALDDEQVASALQTGASSTSISESAR